MAKAKVEKYSVAMVAALTAAAETGPLTAERCLSILENDPAFAGSDITHRGVIAKVRSLNLPYEKKGKVSKTGEPVATKETLAAEIAKAVGVDKLPSLAKAEKRDLRILLAALTEAAELAA